MTSPFDADDLMKRGLLSSIMGFKRKTKTQESHPQNHTPVRINVQPCPVEPIQVRTPNEIFREIVCECEHLERSNTATPFSDQGSSPTSPLRAPLSPHAHGLPNLLPSPYHYEPQAPILHDQSTTGMVPAINMSSSAHAQALIGPAHPPSHTSQYDMYALPYSPPPYSTHDAGYRSMPSGHIPQHYSSQSAPIPAPHTPTAPMQPMMYPGGHIPIHPSDLQNNTHLLEGLVKMVVNALMQSSIGEGQQMKESPEDILRRKRQKNNEAAARYRKRQRDARGRSDEELEGLCKRNDELRHTILNMEKEIQNLKEAVLKGK